jgi:hypothetical protein
MKIPVVLSTVHVDISADGHLLIDIDGEPHAEDRPYVRGDLRSVLDGITADLGTAVRVEVHEADGTTYADIATPPHTDDVDLSDAVTPARQPGLSGSGFHPGEEVAVAYVLCSLTADAQGQTTVRLPPMLLARHGHRLVLIGLTSAALAEIEQPA